MLYQIIKWLILITKTLQIYVKLCPPVYVWPCNCTISLIANKQKKFNTQELILLIVVKIIRCVFLNIHLQLCIFLLTKTFRIKNMLNCVLHYVQPCYHITITHYKNVTNWNHLSINMIWILYDTKTNNTSPFFTFWHNCVQHCYQHY